MDRIQGFGPCDGGSIPPKLVQKCFTEEKALQSWKPKKGFY